MKVRALMLLQGEVSTAHFAMAIINHTRMLFQDKCLLRVTQCPRPTLCGRPSHSSPPSHVQRTLRLTYPSSLQQLAQSPHPALSRQAWSSMDEGRLC